MKRPQILIPIGFGVGLVAVPTAFAIFPGWSQWNEGIRIAIIIGWLVVAAVGAFLTVRADNDLHASVDLDRRAIVLAEHRALLRDQFSAMLQPGVGGIPDQYHLSVYAPSPDGQFLVPVFPPAVDFSDPSIFRSDAGLVGQAWSHAQGVLVAKGAAVSGADFKLTAIQRHRYQMFGVVAATVIFDDQDNRVGLLSAIGREDDKFFEGLEGVKLMRNLARSLAWIIPEAVRWMTPRGDEVAG